MQEDVAPIGDILSFSESKIEGVENFCKAYFDTSKLNRDHAKNNCIKFKHFI